VGIPPLENQYFFNISNVVQTALPALFIKRGNFVEKWIPQDFFFMWGGG